MKRKTCFVLVLVLLCATLVSCGQEQNPDEYDIGYEAGRTAGYDEGYESGYDDGHDAGYEEGYDDGREDGYSGGHNDGYEEGFEDGQQGGYDDGYSEGYDDCANGVARYSEIDYSESEYNDAQSYASTAPADTWTPPADRWVPSWVDPSRTVYVSNKSHTIHDSPNCSGMKNYFEMTFRDAVDAGYKFCLNCW